MYRLLIPKEENYRNRVMKYNKQLDDFLNSKELSQLYSILGVEGNTPYDTYKVFDKMYNVREIIDSEGNKIVKPEQKIEHNKNTLKAENSRESLYPLFKELGMVSINSTNLQSPSCIVVLGGAQNACYDRTQYAKKFIQESTKIVCALGCNRVIGPSEKLSPRMETNALTEFDALSDSFKYLFSLSKYSDTVKLGRDANYNSCIRMFDSTDDSKTSYYVLECPSSKDSYRADTLDTLHFFEKVVDLSEDDELLFITNPQYVNGQGITVARWAFDRKIGCSIDITGCFDDDHIATAEEYNPARYCQDLLRILREIFLFKSCYNLD